MRGQCDSFLVETNVHFPTDINLKEVLLIESIRVFINHGVRQINEKHILALLRHENRVLMAENGLNKKPVVGF